MLVIDDITLRVAGRTLLEHASARIPTGHRVGLVGPNGTGKTTLLRAMQGEIAFETGSVERPRGARLAAVAQEAPGGTTTALQAVLAADQERDALLTEAETATDPHRIAEIQTRLADIGAYAAPARAAAILAGLGIGADRLENACTSFSGGWRMRIALAAVLFAEPEVLLLDEPTNHLDLEATLWLENYLKTYPHTVLIVSHDRGLLNRAVQSILHLDQLSLTLYQGNYDQFEEKRRQAQRMSQALAARQAGERARILEFVERFRYKASKARQAQSRLKMLAKMKPVAAVVDARAPTFPFPDPSPLPPPIINLDKVSVGYAPGQPVLSRLNLRIDEDDRIALLGSNGNGKSTLAKLIAGRLSADEGTARRSKKLKIGFFAQHQIEDLTPNKTPLDHLRDMRPYDKEADLRSVLNGFGIDQKRADTVAAKLSGGEKARLSLCLMAQPEPHLLILDEPTNHLDIDSRQALIQALATYQGAVVLVSHDAHLVEAVADRLWLVDKGTAQPFDGDMDDYRRLALTAAGEDVSAPAKKGGDGGEAKSSRRDERRAGAEARAKIAPFRKAVKDAEKQVEKLTALVARIDAQLHDPKIYDGPPEKVTELSRKKADAEKRLEEAEHDWMAAEEALEELTQAEAEPPA